MMPPCLKGYLNMNISFSTTDKQNAIRFFEHKGFNVLNEMQKEFILNNLGKLRVQDPNMYSNPSIECDPKDSQIFVDLILLGNNHNAIFLQLLSIRRFDLINSHLIDRGFDYKKWIHTFTEAIMKAKDFDFILSMMKQNKIAIHEYSALYLSKCEDLDLLNFMLKHKYPLGDYADARMLDDDNFVGVAFLLSKKIITKTRLARTLKNFHSKKYPKPKERTKVLNEILELAKTMPVTL